MRAPGVVEFNPGIQAGAQLIGSSNRWVMFGIVIVIAAISAGVAIFGHQTIKVLETYGAIIFAALSLSTTEVLLIPIFLLLFFGFTRRQ